MAPHAALAFVTRISLCCFFLVSFTACTTTPVHVVHPQQFELMAARMPQELVARKLLTTSQNYTVALAPLNTPKYGDILYQGLNPAFLIGDTVSQGPSSFPQSLAPNERVQLRPTGFSIEATSHEVSSKGKPKYGAAGRRIDVDMIAITDWEGDGGQDWILTCRYIKNYGAYPRIYYVVVPQSGATAPTVGQKLQSTVVAIYEEAGPKGRIYLRDSKAQQTSAPRGTNTTFGSSHVQDVVPGLKNVTEPPSSTKKAPANSVQERDI